MMEVEDIVWVVGRGHIVCSHMDGRTIRVGDKVMAGDTEFEVRGIERWHVSNIASIARIKPDVVKQILREKNLLQ